MANQQLFSATPGMQVPVANALNNEGKKAYSLGARGGLAQMAATGCFGATYYTTAEQQLQLVLLLAKECDVTFVAKCAIYSRERGHMKDMPALLLAHLASRGPEGVAALRDAWPHVVDNGKMLRNFVQIVRSGVTGRKSFGTAVKRLILSWLQQRSPEGLFKDNVGQKPSMADVIQLVHPTPDTEERRALYGYLLGIPEHKMIKHPRAHGFEKNGSVPPRYAARFERKWSREALPQLVKEYEAFKALSPDVRTAQRCATPSVPFQMLDALGLDTAQWTDIALNAGWQMTRMNLNTFKRHGVLNDPKVVKLLAARLRNPEEIAKARVFPYQLLAAYEAATDIPFELREALQDAMDISVDNVPEFGCRVVVCPDVSPSMQMAVTGQREGSTSVISCAQAAAVLTAAVLRKNRDAAVLPFSTGVHNLALNPRDSIMTISKQIGALRGSGTACSAPLATLNNAMYGADLVIYASDYESWHDRSGSDPVGTSLMHQWAKFKVRNPKAKLVCIDLAPNTTSQASSAMDRLNVGGFSDAVFDVIESFVKQGDENHWMRVIEES